MAEPSIPFHSTLLNRSSEKRAAARFAGRGNRLAQALPSPFPAGPWHEAQLAAKRDPPRLTSSCKSSGFDAGCRTGALSLYPPVIAIGTVGGVALAEGSLAMAMAGVAVWMLDVNVCWSKPDNCRARPRDSR